MLAYIEGKDHDSRKQINMQILDTAIRAVERASSNLQTVILQTGGKRYFGAAISRRTARLIKAQLWCRIPRQGQDPTAPVRKLSTSRRTMGKQDFLLSSI